MSKWHELQRWDYFALLEGGPIPGRKTREYLVRQNSTSATLGRLRWYGRWRQYVFYPEPHTIFSAGCLDNLQDVLALIKARHAADYPTEDES